MGAMLGEVLGQAAEDYANRALSTREEARVATVLDAAAGKIAKLIGEGEVLRSDGFFDSGDDDADEVLEGVLRAAQDEHQQKKLPHLASVFANIAFSPQVTVEAANLVIRESEAISWLEMCLLSMIYRPEEFPLPALELENNGASWGEWTVTQTFNSMTGDMGPLYFPPRYPERRFPLYDMRLQSIKLSSRGILLANMMDLDIIDRSEIDGAYEVLKRFTKPEEDE